MAGSESIIGQALDINNLSFEINDKRILHDINLKVNIGEFVGFIGPNGAGKTTLLKCINRINKYRGQVKINGQNIDKMNDRNIAREVSIMHQNTTISFPFPSIMLCLWADILTKKDLREIRRKIIL